MARQHIVVDGSNIATEGRSAPSLAQLEGAVGELRAEYPEAEVTVIVDATFAHRIDVSELEHFEAAVLKSEYVHPPAGAIGRGDAFLLRIAEKVDATVLSNDSFQEFHGEHPWLFDRGRLLGATPVPGVGWIFTPRTPVRGPTSRKAVRETDQAKRQVSKAIQVATKEAVRPGAVAAAPKRADTSTGSSRRSAATAAASLPPPAAVNDPLTFVGFIAEHPLGAEVLGTVVSYTSHGAVVVVQGAQCYVPLANLGHPAPRSAREVLQRGEERLFTLRALDPQRRGVELALPGVGEVSGQPSEEMIKAEMEISQKGPSRARVGAAALSSPGAKAAASAVLSSALGLRPPPSASGVEKALGVDKASGVGVAREQVPAGDVSATETARARTAAKASTAKTRGRTSPARSAAKVPVAGTSLSAPTLDSPVAAPVPKAPVPKAPVKAPSAKAPSAKALAGRRPTSGAVSQAAGAARVSKEPRSAAGTTKSETPARASAGKVTPSEAPPRRSSAPRNAPSIPAAKASAVKVPARGRTAVKAAHVLAARPAATKATAKKAKLPVSLETPAATARKTPAAKTPAAKTPAAKTPAAKTPAAKTPAAKTLAGKSAVVAKKSTAPGPRKSSRTVAAVDSGRTSGRKRSP